MKNLKNVFVSIIVGTFETLIIKLICEEIEWSTMLLIFVIGTILGLLFIEYMDNWNYINILINNKFKTKIKINEVEGFFGREEIIENIVEWFRDTSEFQIGIIYGYGGSGKTKLAKEFARTAKNYCNSIVVSNSQQIPVLENINNYSIVFIDYVYEYIKDRNELDKIRAFIAACENSEKRISLVLLERTNLIEYVLYALDLDKENTKKINLNETNINNAEILRKIFKYRLNRFDEQNIEVYVQLILDRFDRQYARPIFAHIMSDLLVADSEIDFGNYGAKNRLIEDYWKYRLKRKQFDSFLFDITEHKGGREDIIQLRTILIDKAESLMLFSILTSLTIIVDDTGRERKIIVQDRNGKVYENQKLVDQIKKILVIGNDNIEIRNMMLAQLFPTENGQIGYNKVIIAIDTYDIISAWLLTHFISRTEEGNKNLIDLIRCVNSDLGNVILSFVTRGTEGDRGTSLLWWQKNFLLGAFNEWNGIGYEEWLKNCFELYSNSEREVQECVITILRQFITELQEDEIKYKAMYDYIEWLKCSFRADNNMESVRLVELLNLQKHGLIKK